MKKYLFPFLIFIILLCFQYGLVPFFGPETDSVRIIAHRGDSAHAPENTIPAFLSAMRKGADFIELDIRRTRDGVPVVFHDANLRRLTGKDLPVSDLTCREFLSQTITPAGVASDYPKITACTLEDVLALCEKHPGLCFHLELKIPDIEEKVVSLLQKYDSICSYEISSSDPDILLKIKQLDPDAETFLVLTSAGDVLKYFLRKPDNLSGISVKSVHVTASLVYLAKKRGHKIYAWTVDDTFELRRLRRLGVSGIITDDPSLTRKILS